MDEKMKRLIERIPKEKHEFAMLTLTILASIKDECWKNKCCESCRFYEYENNYVAPCCFLGDERYPKDWNEYDMTERIYK